jgi:hypothetical protein
MFESSIIHVISSIFVLKLRETIKINKKNKIIIIILKNDRGRLRNGGKDRRFGGKKKMYKAAATASDEREDNRYALRFPFSTLSQLTNHDGGPTVRSSR